ncbi:hypothetical protein DXG03_008577 [Asterophora parasitica]|uniref:BTB domain-containing protein n=1 Tax=Asterophora parasitica TaxID=117018 RepID=A0A9P7GBU0_9AGAR|nr:hypothetical protein DXG03_008577 [Asterophora parasitica]
MAFGTSEIIPTHHPVFWFDDGSVVFRVEDHTFKVHRTLLARHSNFFARTDLAPPPNSDVASDPEIDLHIVVDPSRRIRAKDVEVLLEHFYHDVPIFSKFQIPRLIAVLRVSSPLQLDFPSIHALARERLSGASPHTILPSLDLEALEETLALAKQHELLSIQKALYYHLVTSSDAHFEDDEPDPTESPTGHPIPTPDSETAADADVAHPQTPHPQDDETKRLLSALQSSLISHFTPILFTPPATPHMACTDVFADTWMSLVIAPAIASGGVTRPIETLEGWKGEEWKAHGLCDACVEEKKAEWGEEQGKIWEMMDLWLSFNLDEMSRGSRLTLDPVQTVHRPLVWYSVVCLVDTITSLNLLYLGFKHYSATRRWFQTFPPRPLLSLISRNADLTPDILLPYWYRPHRSTTELPIVFLHGIGIGLHPYLPFIRDTIAQSPDIGILLVEFLPISMHMTTHPVPPAPLIASALNNILDSLNIPRVVVVAHSYGTFITSCVLRDSCTSHHTSHDSIYTPPSSSTPSLPIPHAHPLLPKLAHTLLIDPIPVLLHLPPVAHNFLYRAPREAAEWQLWYFASTDPDVARTLGRAFFWTEGVAWKEDVRGWMRVDTPAGTEINGAATHTSAVGGSSRRRHIAMVLAGKDQIVPAESVRRYLTGSPEASARWVGKGWADWVVSDEDTAEAGQATSGGSLPISGASGTETVANGNPLERGNVGQDVERTGGDLEVLFYPELDHATVFDSWERRKPVLEVLGRFVRDI